jgi:hypothetical protein
LIGTYDAEASPTTPLTIASIEEQDTLESRRAWAKVAAAIAAGDMEATGIEKSKIENEQRALRQKEQAENRTWQRRYFSNVESDTILDTLGSTISLSVDADKTGGIWKLDEKKAEAWRTKTGASLHSAELE